MNDSKFRIAITRPLPGSALNLLRDDGFENIVSNENDRALSSAELHELIAGAHAVITTPVDKADAAFFDAAGEQLRVVSNYAVGFDNIDVAEATRRDVLVGHTPNAVTEPTADIAWLLLLTAARRAREGFELVTSGQWSGVGPNELLGTRIVGKTLLIVGAGRIGLATARRSIGWEMDMLYHARSQHPEFEAPPIGAKRVGLDEGLKVADFVSLHTPLTEETHHLIDASKLALMKESAVLINTARGAVIDEAALYQTLKAQKIAAAGLDVFENEPTIHPGLAELPNVFLMPHLGSATNEDRTWMTEIAVGNAIAGLRGEDLPHRVRG